MTTGKRRTMSIILAAGKGTRMKSDLPKVLHTILGKPLVSYVIDACTEAGVEKIMLVVGHQAEKVKDIIGPGIEYALQRKQLGTGHALMTAVQGNENFQGDALVLVGDAPFLTGDILKQMIKRHQETRAAATMMTAIINPPPAYGRIVRDTSGRVCRIVEERDATPDERKISEVNTSHYIFTAEKVFPLLDEISTNNDQGEYYLTDIIELLSTHDELIETLTVDDPDVLKGINTKEELLEAEDRLRQKE